MNYTYNRTFKLDSRKTNCAIRKWAKYTNRHCTEEDNWMVNRNMKRYSVSLTMKPKQIQPTMRPHYMPLKVDKIK